MDAFFQFLFKYRWIVFRRGHIGFDTPLPVYSFILLALLFLGATLFTYRKQLSMTQWEHHLPVCRLLLVILRATVFLLVLITLARPVLRVPTLLPRENIAVLLLDDSRSMTLSDEGGQQRLSAVKTFLKHSNFLAEVNKRFRVRLLKFSKKTERIDSVESLKGEGEITGLKIALDSVLTNFETEPLSSVILFTDGAENVSPEFGSIVHRFQQKGIALYTCGVGRTSMSKDIELLDANSVRTALAESILTADVTLRSDGFEGKTANLELREDGRLLQTKPVRLEGNQGVQTFKVQFAFNGTGLKQYTVSTSPFPGEVNPWNNSRGFLIQMDESKPKVLYIEGAPRWEFKFIRQALEQDKRIRLLTLLRTSSNKFYRQGIESEDALATGFPTTREELFPYQALILGSVESSFFSKEQQAMIVDFVGERGAGFMMLGGKNSFDEGKYANSPIADILPVVLGNRQTGSSYLSQPLKLGLTEHGKRHPLTQLSPEESQNETRWRQLPNVEEFNWINQVKSGAIVLATGKSDRGTAVLFAVQRFGRGRTVAFMPSDSWHWQMGMPHEDDSHEVFWRQGLRWLVSSSPSQVNVELNKSTFFRHETIQIRTIVYDSLYKYVNAATVMTTIVPPSGNPVTVPLRWSHDQEGLYTGEYEPAEPGLFKVEVSATQNDKNLGRSECHFFVSQDSLEFYNAGQNREILERLAQETGGQYYSLAQAVHLPEEMSYASHPNAVPQTLALWDMPALFLLLCTLLIAEWSLRKRVRLL